MSRRRVGTLTGGSGDVNPQFLSTSLTQSAADTATTLQINVPIQRLRDQGRAQVLEILKVKYSTGMVGGTAATEVNYSITALLSTVSFGTTATTYQEPRVFSMYDKEKRSAFTAAGTYALGFQEPFTDDLSDGDGHGYLVATDSIFLQVLSANTSAANQVAVKIYYRWKNVGLTEYIGIVQSQQ